MAERRRRAVVIRICCDAAAAAFSRNSKKLDFACVLAPNTHGAAQAYFQYFIYFNSTIYYEFEI